MLMKMNDIRNTGEKICALAPVYWDDCERAAELLELPVPFFTEDTEVKTVALFYHRLHNGGAERVTSMLCPILQEKGYEVIVITDESEDPEDYPIPGGVRRIILGTVNDGKDYPERYEKLSAGIEDCHIDAVIYSGWKPQQLFWDMCTVKSCGARFFIYNHGIFINALNNGWDRIIRYRISEQFADGIVVLTEADRLYWSRINSNVFCLPNPLPFRVSDCLTAPLDSHNITWVGRVDDPNKNAEDALRIVSMVKQRVPDVKLFMVGYAEENALERLKQLSDQLGISENVVFTGFCMDVMRYYNCASVFLCTSAFEGFCLSLGEALSTGVPAVTYEMPYLSIVQITDAVIQAPYKHYQTMAELISKILIEDEFRKELGKKAKEGMKYFDRYDYGEAWNTILRGEKASAETRGKAIDYDRFCQFAYAADMGFSQMCSTIQSGHAEIYSLRSQRENNLEQICSLNQLAESQKAQIGKLETEVRAKETAIDDLKTEFRLKQNEMENLLLQKENEEKQLKENIAQIYRSKRYRLGYLLLYIPDKLVILVKNIFKRKSTT